MTIQLQQSIKGSIFASRVMRALHGCSKATKNACDAVVTRCGNEIEIELTARDLWGFTRSPARDVCRQLKFERCTVLGVDAWQKTPCGLATGATIVCETWGAFEDIDLKKESEVVQ